MYRETRERLTALVAGLDAAQLATPVPARPGWSVADVIGHLAAIPEDAPTGRLTGPPSEAETAVQVDRFRRRHHRVAVRRTIGWPSEIRPGLRGLGTFPLPWVPRPQRCCARAGAGGAGIFGS